ncbi:hypothetical protein QBB31_25320 [Streptomyces scabiei]
MEPLALGEGPEHAGGDLAGEAVLRDSSRTAGEDQVAGAGREQFRDPVEPLCQQRLLVAEFVVAVDEEFHRRALQEQAADQVHAPVVGGHLVRHGGGDQLRQRGAASAAVVLGQHLFQLRRKDQHGYRGVRLPLGALPGQLQAAGAHGPALARAGLTDQQDVPELVDRGTPGHPRRAGVGVLRPLDRRPDVVGLGGRGPAVVLALRRVHGDPLEDIDEAQALGEPTGRLFAVAGQPVEIGAHVQIGPGIGVRPVA